MQESVQVVDRVFDVIECLAKSRAPMGPTKLADATGLNKSTVYRLLATLCARGYVERSESEGTYFLGPKLIELVSYHINTLELQTEARPYLAALSALGLTAHLGTLYGWEVIYVEKLDVVPSMRVYAEIGERVPAYCSSLGKCLLASLSGDELDEALADCKFQRFTPHTLTTMSELRQCLREARIRGWAMDDEEQLPGQRCVGAPIYDYRGDCIAAISASGPAAKLTDQFLPTVVSQVKAAASQLSRRMGYTG